jgi:hypothetical protein
VRLQQGVQVRGAAVAEREHLERPLKISFDL